MVNWSLITFGVYLFVILAATYYVSRQMRNVDVDDYESEFYVGGRNLGVLVTAILVAAGAVSAGTFVGAPGLTWEYGAAFGIYAFFQFTINLHLLGTYGKKIAIISRRINANSLIDIYKERYDAYGPFMLMLVATIVIFLEAYLSSEYVGGARIIASVTGLPYIQALLAFGIVIVIYTTLGGLRGTGIVGVIQGIAMTVGVLILLVGALSNGTDIFQSMESIDPSLIRPPGKGISWIYFISSSASIFLGGLALPHAIQGTLGYDSTKVLKRSAGLGVVVVTLWTTISIIAGVAGKSLNPSGIPPDQNIPLLALQTMPGVPAGLILAGIVGAAQTTIGVIVILVSSALVVNVYTDYIQPDASPERRQLVSSIATAAVGILGLLIAILQPPLLGAIVIFSIGGVVSGALSPLLLGVYWPRANKYGAFAGSFTGTVSYILLSVWGPAPLSRNPILVSLLLSIIFMIGVSLTTEKPSKEIVRIYFGSE